jgi:cytochrome b561
MLDTSNSYSFLSKFFHWARAILLLIVFILALNMENFRNLLAWHIAFASILFLIVICNILWRLFNVYPKSTAVNILEKNIQFVVYFGIYLLLLIIPIMGYLSLSYSVNILGIEIKPLYSFEFFNNLILDNTYLDNATVLASIIKWVHIAFAWFLVFLIAMHIIAGIVINIKTKGIEFKRMM